MADTPPKERFTASNAIIHTWGIGYVSNYWMIQQIMLIMIVFTTDFKMAPWLVVTVLAVPRLIDLVLDPLIGHWSDITHTRMGRRRPFMLVATFVGAIGVFAMWRMSPDWAMWAKVCYLGVASTVLYLAFSTFEMSYYSLGYELSEDYSGRSKVFAIKGVYHALASVMGGYAYTTAIALGAGCFWQFGIPSMRMGGWTVGGYYLFSGKFPDCGGTINGVRYISLFIIGMIVIFGLIPVIFCRERYTQANRKHVNTWQAFKATMTCRPFVLLIILQGARALGTSLFSVFYFYIGVFYVCSGDKLSWTKVMAGAIGLVGFFFALIIWPLAKPLTRKLGKRWGLFLGYASALAYACVLPFVIKPGNVDILFWLMVASLPLQGIMGLFSQSVMPDICDMDELAHGERREGLFTAVQSFINKAESWVIGLCGGILLSLAGFDPNLTQQTPETFNHMLWLALTPLIFFTAVAVVIAWFLPFSAEVMEDVHAKLAVHHAAAAAAKDLGPNPATS